MAGGRGGHVECRWAKVPGFVCVRACVCEDYQLQQTPEIDYLRASSCCIGLECLLSVR